MDQILYSAPLLLLAAAAAGLQILAVQQADLEAVDRILELLEVREIHPL
jgi:hypothetical protein